MVRKNICYQDAGVDINAGNELIRRIKPFAERTRIAEQLGNLGGLAGLCSIPRNIKEPILVSSTDGVGTKLKIAFAVNKHETIGIDLVAMCVNDIITCGAKPLFFLDYFSSSKLDIDTAEKVISGIADGCQLADCALIGGETAEMPGFYSQGEYDLAGFSVGIVEKSKIIDGSRVQTGDVVLGISSSGLHSNGYSLARKVLLETAMIHLDSTLVELGEPLFETLLRPTRIYVKAIQAAISVGDVRALCHITGGGLLENLPRVLPKNISIQLNVTSLTKPPIFGLIQKYGNIQDIEMYRTFNMGIGFVLIIPQSDIDSVLHAIEDSGEYVKQIGQVVANHYSDTPRVHFV